MPTKILCKGFHKAHELFLNDGTITKEYYFVLR